MGKVQQIRSNTSPVSYVTSNGAFWSIKFVDGVKISGDGRNSTAMGLCDTLQRAIWDISKKSGQQKVGDLCSGYQKNKTVLELLSI